MSFSYLPMIAGCRLVDAYDILQYIGSGSYGTVYRAKDRQTNDICALKQLQLDDYTANGIPQTTLREILLLLKCRGQEHIINVREIVTNRHVDKVYIVMDYMPYNLSQLILNRQKRIKDFSAVTIQRYVLQLLRGLDYLHENWIMHRDLKPSNVLVAKNGTVKIADFGMSRTYGMPLGHYTNMVTTLFYRAPELLFGATAYDATIDIWSLGCIFAELLLLHPLFMGHTELQQINCIFEILGTPDHYNWPDFHELPAFKQLLSVHAFHRTKSRLKPHIAFKTNIFGFQLLQRMLSYNPAERIRAHAAMEHEFFKYSR